MVAQVDGSGARRPLLMRWASDAERRPLSPTPSTPSTTPTTPLGEERRRIERRMATVREPALCRCTPLLAFRVLDTALVLSLLVVQGSALNFYLISQNHRNSTYFWFIGDLAIVLVSMGAMISSYHHVRVKVRRRIQPINLGLQPIRTPPPPSKLGVLPFTYSAWFIYSCLLVSRLATILHSGLDSPPDEDSNLTPQLLRVILSLSAAIFFFQVHAYHSSEWGSTKHLAILGVSFTIVLEILDSIDLASLLIGDVLDAPASLEATILGFASLNLVLPTFALYRLSLTDFGERAEYRIVALVHVTVKTIGFDLPALILRVFLWTQCSHVSIGAFLVKNGICLVAWLRYSLPDGVRYFRSYPKSRKDQGLHRPQSTVTAIATNSGSVTTVPGATPGQENVELKVIHLNT